MIQNANQSGLFRRTLVLLLMSGAVAVAVPASVVKAADQSGAPESSANNPAQNQDAARQVADLKARIEKLEVAVEKNQMKPMECCRLGMKGAATSTPSEAPKP